MRLLIADSSAVVRERLTDLLADISGIEIVGQAKNAREAKGLARKLKPDVAILELQMPQGRGADVLLDLKKITPAPKVIMLTNYAFPESRQKCLKRGADYFFDKSTEFEQVLAILRDMVLVQAHFGAHG